MEEYSPFDEDDGESMDLETPTTTQTTTQTSTTTTTTQAAAQLYQQPDTSNTSAWGQNPVQQYYAQYYSDPYQQQQQQAAQTQAQPQAQSQTGIYSSYNGQMTYAQYAAMGTQHQQQQQPQPQPQQIAYLSTDPSQTKPQPHIRHQFQYSYNPQTMTIMPTQTPPPTTNKADNNKLKFKIQAPKNKSRVPTSIKAFESSSPAPPPPQASPPPPPPSSSPSPSSSSNPPPPSPTKKKKEESDNMWPPSLRKYVERAFEACKTQEERISTESYLKEKIQQTMQNETVWSYNWDIEPLPLEREPKSGEKRKRSQKKVKKEIEKVEKPKKKKGFMYEYSTETEEERRKINQRANRFKECFRKPSFMAGDIQNTTIIQGTCTNLEKKYLRLTTAADPSLVRPERVLKESVEMIKRKWKGREVDYLYVCEQFKSIRQDLTVQHIKNAFTVKVYEMHGRLAIENGDIGEYNQCQTQLTVLYASGIQGNRAEFIAYAILYFSMKDNQEGLGSYLKKIPVELMSDPSVKYALDTHRAYATRNFYRFFKLLRATPHLNSHLIHLFLDKLRLQSVNALISACKPSIPVDYLKKLLYFESNKACIQWLRSHGGVVSRDRGGLMTKESKMRGLISDKVGSTKIT